MDGNPNSKSAAWSCRICPKHFNSFDQLRLHEQSHMDEQISYSAAMQPQYDGMSLPMYTNSQPPNSVNGNFQGMAQQYRSSIGSMDGRPQIDTRGVVSPSMMPANQADQRIINPNPPDMKNVMPSNPGDVRNMGVSSQADARNFATSSTAEHRGMVPSSPADPRSMVPSSPADPRGMVPSSPADPRSMVPSSPADPRSMVPSSPADPRSMFPSSPANMVAHSPAGMVAHSPAGMVAHSPAGEQRNMVVSSPVDQQTVMASSPLDPRMMAVGPHDPRVLVSVNSGMNNSSEQRNMTATAGTLDPRNLMPSSPGMVATSAANQRLAAGGQIDQRNMGSPAEVRSVLPQSPVEPRPPMSVSQADSKETERSRIQSIVADIRTLENRNTTDHRGFLPPNSMANTHRREDGPGFSAVSRSDGHTAGVGAMPPVTFDGRMMPTDTLHMIPNCQPLTYNSGSYLESLTRDLYPQELTQKLPSTVPYSTSQLSLSVHSMGNNRELHSMANNRELGPAKPDAQTYYDPSKYYQQSFPIRAPPSYEMNKMGAQFGNQSGVQDPSTKVEHLLHNPKQTLHYGQTNKLLPHPNHSQSFDGIPKPDQSNQLGPGQQCSQPPPQHAGIASPIPIHGSVDQRFAYPSSPAHPISPNYPYSQMPPKASALPSQIHAPVPSRPVPNQQGFRAASSTEQNASVQKVTCHLCLALFPNMLDLSEHMKIHAKGLVSHGPQPKPTTNQQPINERVNHSNNGADKQVGSQVAPENQGRQCTESRAPPNTIPTLHSGMKDKAPVHNLNSNSSNEQFKCKICKKVFKSQEKCWRHEGHHMRDVRLVYCELCEQAFEFKANYLFHMVKSHGSVGQTEPQVGTKKAVPLTGGTIDRSFESEESETEAGKMIHCQLCDTETERDQLVNHLKTHQLFECDKCDGVFIQKTEYVAHLISDHRNELSSGADKVNINFSPPKLNNNPPAENKNIVPPLILNTGSEKKSTPYVKKTPAEKQKAKEEKQRLREKLKEEKKLEKKLIKEKEKAAKREAKFAAKAEAKEAKKLEKQQERERKKSEKRQGKGVVYESNDTLTTPSILSEDTDRSQAAFTNVPECTESNGETKTDANVITVNNEAETSLDRAKSVDQELMSENQETSKALKTPAKTEVKYPCSQCDKSFISTRELREHGSKHVRDPDRFYCEICLSNYHRTKEKGYYIYHMMYHQDSDLAETDLPNDMRCLICQQAVTKDKLVSHIKREHAQYSCEICEWSYSCEKVLVSHMRRIHPKTHKQYVYVPKNYENTILEWNDSEPEDANNDPSEMGSEISDPAKTIACKHCERTFSKKQYFERHMRSHAALEDAQIHCELCNKMFGCKGAYLYHVVHHPSGSPSERSSDVDNEALLKMENSLKSETKVKEGFENIDNTGGNTVLEAEGMAVKKGNSGSEAGLKSEITSEKVNSDRADVNVVKTVLNPMTGEMEEQVVKEDMCNEDSMEQGNKRTMEVASGLNDSKESVEEKEAPCRGTGLVSELVYCKVCSKCLKKADLRQHIETHALFNCDLCEFAFLKKQKLKEHRKALHLEDYIADEIRMFEVVEGLHEKDSSQVEREKDGDTPGQDQQEQQDKHNIAKKKRGARILGCSLCNLDLKQDKFVEHLKTHIKTVLRCQFCERNFSKPHILKMHEKSHERIAYSQCDLPHPKLCPICDLKMASRESYVQHLRGHKRKGPFTCKTCQKVFTSEKSLENHTKVYHDVSVKVYWQEDGEGLRFDPRTSRISEVVSDYLTEVREINELYKCNGKPQICHGITPKKSRDHRTSSVGKCRVSEEGKAAERSVTESETNTESEEKMKTDTSDEEYVPEESDNDGKPRRRSVRIAKKTEEASEGDDTDEEEPSSRKTRKRRHSARLASDDDSSDDDSEAPSKSRQAKVRKLVPNKKSKFTVAKKGGKLLMRRKVGHRVLRSTLDKVKPNLKKVGLKRKMELRKKEEPEKKLRRGDSSLERSSRRTVKDESSDRDYPEKCPVCGTFQFSAESYEAHARIHSGESKYVCTVCESSFVMKKNLDKHMTSKHPGYTPKNLRQRKSTEPTSNAAGRLQTRSQNLEKEKMEPVSTSTPKRSPKLVVQISPLELDKSPGEKKNKLGKQAANKQYYSNVVKQNKDKMGKFKCDICQKTITRRWNYAQHMLGHKEVSDKHTVSKKDSKGKDFDGKPFTCKDCSQCFKKKRDLYIHTKVHQVDGNGSDCEESSDKGLTVQSSPQDLSGKSVSAVSDMYEKTGAGRPRKSAQASNRSNVEDQAVNTSVQGRKRVLAGCDSDSNLSVPEKHFKVSDSDSSPVKRKDDTSGRNVAGQCRSSECQDSVQGLKSEVAASPKNSGGSVGRGDSPGGGRWSLEGGEGQSQWEDSARSECSDVEERRCNKPQTPLTKLTAEKALQKWREKVQATLTAQLELHAAKKQEKMANPDIARLKEKLSTKAKSEVKNFECRICGEKFNAETSFRKHMEEHLYESPPYCTICDIYFMAIYPKKRLADHNRKKHPII